MDIWRILQILKSRKWTITITAVVACILITPAERFRSSAKLLLNTQMAAAQSFDPTMPMATSSGWLGDPVILKEIILSQDFLEKHVLVNGQLKMSWPELRDQIDMKALTGGHVGACLVEIDAEDADPKQAQVIAQAVADNFTQYVPELMAREYDGNRKFLERLVGEAKGQLDDAENSILSWQQEHHYLTAGDAYQEQMKTMSRMDEERAVVAQRLAAVEARCEVLRSYKPGDTPPLEAIEGSDKGRNSHVAEIQGMLATEQAKLGQLRLHYKPGEPILTNEEDTVKQIQDQLQNEVASEVKSILKDSDTELKEDKSQLASLDASMKVMRSQMAAGRDNLDFAKRQRAIDLWEKNYQDLMSSLYKARIVEQNAARRGAITLLEAPTLGVRVSVVPKTFQKRLSIAIVVGLVLGIMLAVALEFISRSLKVANNVEEILELRVLGTVPRLPKEMANEWRDAKNHLVTGSGGRSANGKTPAAPVPK